VNSARAATRNEEGMNFLEAAVRDNYTSALRQRCSQVFTFQCWNARIVFACYRPHI